MRRRSRTDARVTGRSWPGQAAGGHRGPPRPPPPPWDQQQRPAGQMPDGFTNPVFTGTDPAHPWPQGGVAAGDTASNGAVSSAAPESASESTQDSPPTWEPLVTGDRPSRWVRVRRVAVLGALGAVMVVGAVDVVQTAAGVVVAPPAEVAPAISDQQLAGFATAAAVDYASWDSSSPAQRQAALARYAAPGTAIDGWDGHGRQWADAPSVLAVHRDGARAVATVRVRVMPAPEKQAAPAGQDARGDAGALAAAAPGPDGAGSGSARWLTLALPLAERAGKPVITARPALVGSAPERVPASRLSADSTGDTALAKSTEPALGRLLSAYASGDLSYARRAGTTFAGLDGAARLGEVGRWQLAEPSRSSSEQDGVRHGRAEVTWQLSGGAGALTSDYAIDLTNENGRWYLAAVGPDTPEETR